MRHIFAAVTGYTNTDTRRTEEVRKLLQKFLRHPHLGNTNLIY